MDIGAVSSFPATRPTAFRAVAAAPGVGVADGAKSDGDGAVYISPAIKYDQTARIAVLLFRDADTGETKEQIPSEHVVEAYRRTAGRAPDGLAHSPVTLQGGSSGRAPAGSSAPTPSTPAAPSGGSPTPAQAAGSGSGGSGGASLSVTV